MTLSDHRRLQTMTIEFTTDQLARRDRIPYWVDVASKAFYAHGFTAHPVEFEGQLSSFELGAITLTRCDCGPCKVTRTRQDTARDALDDLMLCIRLEGRSEFKQADRRVFMEAGTVLFHDASRPLEIDFKENTRSYIVGIPRQLIQPRIGDANIERVMSARTPVTGTTVEFIKAVIARAEEMDPALHHAMAQQLVDLVSLAFAGEGTQVLHSTARTNALRRLKGVIEKRLSDPGLTPSTAAEAARMSVRYANALLAEEESSLERFIQSRRLEHCRRTLEDPRQGHRMISEIAFAWGFSDQSHFTRRFRAAFGMTPGDCRQLSRTSSR